MPKCFTTHLEIRVGYFWIDIAGMIECKSSQRTVGIKLGKGIEPSGNILGVYLYPTFQTDGCPGVAENKDVHNESHHTAPLVQRTNAAG